MKMIMVKERATKEDFYRLRKQTAYTKARFEKKLKASVAKVDTDIILAEEEREMDTVCGDFLDTLNK